MKKVIVGLMVVAGVLTGCDNPSSAGDKFVGTWNGSTNCQYETVMIQKNNGGEMFTVVHSTNREESSVGSNEFKFVVPAIHKSDTYSANLDGDTLIIKGQTDLPIKVIDNSIEIKNCKYQKNTNS